MIHTDTLSWFLLLYLCPSTGEVWERHGSGASRFGSIALRRGQARFGGPRAGFTQSSGNSGAPWVGPILPARLVSAVLGGGCLAPQLCLEGERGSFPSAPWFIVYLA